METKEISKLVRVPNYIGTFFLHELVSIRICTRTSYLVINLRMSRWIGVAIYPNRIYICDPMGVLSTGLPPQLTEFLRDLYTETHVHITNQLSSVICAKYVILFLHNMSKYHSYSNYMSNFSSDLDLNDYVTNYLYEKIK